MAEEDRDNPGFVTVDLCQAHREAILGQISDVKKALDRLDARLWYLLGGILLTIILSIATIVLNVVR